MSGSQSLRSKLVWLVVAAVGAATAVATVVSLWQQISSYSEVRRQALVTTAQVFAASAGPATAGNNEIEAFQSLRAIGRMADIQQAEIRTNDGRRLATAGVTTHLVDDLWIGAENDVSILDLLTSGSIRVSVPVVNAGDRVGQLTLVGDISDLWLKLIYTSLFTIMGGAFALIVGVLVASRLQRSITGPIYNLIGAMDSVRQTHRYDLAVPDAPDREIGQLVAGFNHMLRDVRERDERLEAHRQNLEVEVADRTHDLRLARDVAESANRAKSDFLATMSHEIRTPMNGIMVMADILKGGELPPKQRRYAEIIAKSGRSLLSIINDILDFSKIEAGKLDLESIDVDLNEIAENVISLFAEQARSKGIDLAAFVDPTVPRLVKGDPVRLSQVITNLVNNALKFTEKGSVKVSVGFVGRDRKKIEIAVRDSGIGILDDKLETIFESFSQADQSTTRQFGGTGLGLTICKRLAIAMGGDIRVTSQFGHGSKFSIVIPCREPGESHWPKLNLPAGQSAVCVVDVQGDATRDALTKMFAAAGFEVASFEDASEDGLRIVCTEMSRVNTLRSAPGNPLIIALSDLPGGQEINKSAAAKVDAVIAKPVLRSDVEALLARIIRGEAILQPDEHQAGVQPRPPAFAPFDVLVADDNIVNREVATAALNGLGGVVSLAENGLEAVNALKAGRFDIVFMDGSMPEMDGMTAARHIRRLEAESGRQRTPIIGLTAHVVGVDAQQWHDAGIDAILYKPFTIVELARTIETALPHLTRRAGAAASAEPVNLPSNAPPFTSGIDNEAEGNSAPLIDLGIFGQLTEMQLVGHKNFSQRIIGLYTENAPAALAQIEQMIAAGDCDECARAAHSLKSMSYNIGASRVARLAHDIEMHCREEKELPSEAGVTDLRQALEDTMREVCARVNPPDTEASSPSKANSTGSVSMERALARAFEREEFFLAYQPIVDRAGTTTKGVEALLRWRQESGEELSPGIFIPIAEKSGLIHELGNWVMRRAFADCASWEGVDVSINVSPVQFLRQDFVSRAERAISESALDPGRVILEITESTLLTAESSVNSLMNHLSATGFRFALDDFGTGYASLTSLRRFPFERIKIDRSFVSNLQTTADATIIHAVIAIAKSLALKVVAEGVEIPEQQKFLASAGVNFMQGYLFGKPMTKEEISSRLWNERHSPAAAAAGRR